MRTRSGGPLALGVLAVLVLAACGDSGGDALTKADFLARGNAVCARTQMVLDEAADAAFPNKGKVPTGDETEAFVDRTVLPEVRKEVNELDELKAPKEDRDRVNDIIKAGKAGLDELSVNFFLIASKDRNPLLEYGDLAQAYGLKGCGRNSDKTARQLIGLD